MQGYDLRSTRNGKERRRRRRTAAPSSDQYSLFSAAAPPPADEHHYQRQAALCARLLSGLHQPELVELLGRLHDEFEAKAMPSA